MRIDVTVKGALVDHVAGGRATLDMVDGAPVQAVLEALGLPALHCVFVKNGQAVTKGTALREGDRVVVYPPQAGG